MDEVALERLREAEEESRSRQYHAARADSDRVPIEAPRAPRSNSNLSTSALMSRNAPLLYRCSVLRTPTLCSMLLY